MFAQLCLQKNVLPSLWEEEIFTVCTSRMMISFGQTT